jgi:hypothetical protein
MPIYSTVGLATAAIVLSTLQGGPPAAPTIDDPEAYAVYAAVVVLTSLLVDKPVTNVAILQETVSGHVQFDGVIAREWGAVVVPYWKNNARTWIILEGFDLGIPYSLVPLPQFRKLMEAANPSPLSTGTNHPRAEVSAQVPGDELIALSAVGFNAEKTLATLTIQHDCSPSRDPLITCHRVHQMLLAKKNGRWELVGYRFARIA